MLHGLLIFFGILLGIVILFILGTVGTVNIIGSFIKYIVNLFRKD